jgi:hypothetical protein
VSIDGARVENVVGAEVYRRGYYGYGAPDDDEEPSFAFSVMQAEKDSENDLTKCTRIVAATSPQGQLSEAQAIEGLPELKRVATAGREADRAVNDIIRFFEE